jgi:hypothetical protein
MVGRVDCPLKWRKESRGVGRTVKVIYKKDENGEGK